MEVNNKKIQSKTNQPLKLIKNVLEENYFILFVLIKNVKLNKNLYVLMRYVNVIKNINFVKKDKLKLLLKRLIKN